MMRARWSMGVGVVWVISYLGALVALRRGLVVDPTWLRVATALVPVVPNVLFLWAVIAQVRTLDEFQRRVHLEALVIAYPLAILLLTTLGLLELAIDLPVEDWSYRHVWVYLPFFYFVGLWMARRRYS